MRLEIGKYTEAKNAGKNFPGFKGPRKVQTSPMNQMNKKKRVNDLERLFDRRKQ